MATILETPRLILRTMSLDDLDFIAAMLAHPEVMRFWPRPLSRVEAEEWVDRQLGRYSTNGFGWWLALDRKTGEPIGQMGLVAKPLDGIDEVEIAYMVHRPFWRNVYASEGATACREYAFHTLGRPRVLCLIRPENTPSLGVARKIGLTTDNRIIHHFGSDHLVFKGERSL